ncbi:MAG: hypothetical protein OXC62_15880 [Aestuariivita sp.]|nr:hypothetical protein [Aestuariivita sp.]
MTAAREISNTGSTQIEYRQRVGQLAMQIRDGFLKSTLVLPIAAVSSTGSDDTGSDRPGS